MRIKLLHITFIVYLLSFSIYGQDITLYQQFNGRYDFTFIGNGLNPQENSYMPVAQINTSSSAILSLDPNDQIQNAYLYWAGCGPGDYSVKLNNQTITPNRIFTHQRVSNGNVYDYFSAFTDVTNQVRNTGNGTYTLSDLDLNEWIPYYYGNRTNFGGWAIIIVYKNNNLPLNQVNVYDGLQAVPNEISFTLNNLNVVDNQHSKIGFLAWEGDQNIAVGESLFINDNLVSNLPFNPEDNAFNGTNTFNNTITHNMDLDVYNLDDDIHIGDTSATIRLTSGQDFVMINAIATKLISLLPDATITIDRISTACNSNAITVHYTASNMGATGALPAGVPIAIYVNGIYFQSTQTQNEIEVDGSESGTIMLTIPDDIESPFNVQLVIDDNGNHQGNVIELQENNNDSALENTSLYTSKPLGILDALVTCNEGYSIGTFDFSAYEMQIKQDPTDVATFYPTVIDMENETNEITNLTDYIAPATPMRIFVKVDNGNCYNTTSFLLQTKKCKPIVYNYISRNNDGINDTFRIKGLRNVFLNYKLKVYNRWGKLVWTGNNYTPEWDGIADQGIIVNNKQITDGIYFYSLELNDNDYPTPLYGYLYLKE